MPTVGFEPAVSAGKRSQTNALVRAATGIGGKEILQWIIQSILYIIIITIIVIIINNIIMHLFSSFNLLWLIPGPNRLSFDTLSKGFLTIFIS
jgi:hypothetical protein